MRLIIFASLLATSFAALREYGLPSLRGSNGGLSNGHLKNGLANGHFGSVNGHIGAGHDAGRFNGQGVQSSDFGGHVQVSETGTSQNGHQQGSFGVPLPADPSFNGGLPAVDIHQDIAVGGAEHRGFDAAQEQTSGDFGSSVNAGTCGEGQVLNSEGLCAEADVSKAIYLYTAPERRARQRSEPAPTPKPKLNYNIVFVKAPEDSEEDKPIVIPPPQQKTIVYVLSKDGEAEQEIIEVPAGPAHKPEVYYISYNEGENPNLSLGLNLESALASAKNEEGKIIEVEISDDISSGQFEFKDDSGLTGQIDQEGIAGLNGQSEFHAGESAGLNGQSGLQAGEYDESSDSQGNGFAAHVNGASGLGNGASGLGNGIAAVRVNGATGFGNGIEAHSNGANGNGYQAQTGGNGFGNGFQAHSNGGNGNGYQAQTGGNGFGNGASGNGNGQQAEIRGNGFGNGASGNGNGHQAQIRGNGFVNGAPFEVKTSSEFDSGEHSQDAGAQLSIHSQNGQSVFPQQQTLQRQQPSGLYNTPRGY